MSCLTREIKKSRMFEVSSVNHGLILKSPLEFFTMNRELTPTQLRDPTLRYAGGTNHLLSELSVLSSPREPHRRQTQKPEAFAPSGPPRGKRSCSC